MFSAGSNPWLLGIDLGTTNTAAVAFSKRGDAPIIVKHGRDRSVLPSIVSYRNPNLPLIGWMAKDMMLSDPLTTVHGWKRFLGRGERSEYVSRHRSRFAFPIGANDHKQLGAVVQGRVRTFTEVASQVLEQVRSQARGSTGHDVRECVISVPAHFAKSQRTAVLDAAKTAGLEVIRLVNEPTAAALAFGAGRMLDQRILIFDLGGGTFDATILEVVNDIFEVKASSGDGFLGGIDFDRVIMEQLVKHIEHEHGVDVRDQPVVAQRVMNAAENAKCALSDRESVRLHVPMLGIDRKGRTFDLETKLHRRDIERLTAPLVEKTIGIVERMLVDCGIAASDINLVVAIGGQSRMPLVRERLAAVLGQVPQTHLDPDTCVAYGAGMVAASSHQLSGAVLMDVLSVPIGIVFPGGRTRFVFEANSALPSSERIPLDPPHNDSGMVVGLWQGPDVTSSERQVLGVVRMPSHLFSAGRDFALELSVDEDLEVEATFTSSLQRMPLALESRRA